MRKLISSLSITADGYCDHNTTIADDEHHRQSLDLLENCSMIVLGRSTYGLFESYWPQAKDNLTLPNTVLELAKKLNTKRKIVVSKTLSHADWENSIVIGDLRQISLLKQQEGQDLLIIGSPGLVSALTKRKMIDEYHFSVQPIIAGKGKRLFGEVIPESSLALKLLGTKALKSGIVTTRYSI